MPSACGAGLKSTNFVLRNIRLPQSIDDINLKYTTMCCLCQLELRSTLQVAVDPDPNQIYSKRKATECSISLSGPSTQNNFSFNLRSIVGFLE